MRVLVACAKCGQSDSMWMLLPTGNVGHVLSSHYRDQAESYLRGTYRTMRVSDSDIGANAEYVMTLTPGLE